jgi:hypothetical protein
MRCLPQRRRGSWQTPDTRLSDHEPQRHHLPGTTTVAGTENPSASAAITLTWFLSFAGPVTARGARLDANVLNSVGVM